MGALAIFILALVLGLDVVKTYEFYDDVDDYREYLEFVASENERGLFPNIFNLATNAIVSVNATCGQEGPESYCKLVEHVFMMAPQCDICDDKNVQKRHPIRYAVDGSERWWQSPTMANGREFETVTITIDLRQQYQVAYVIVKAAISPRPGNWVLEKSLDNETWVPWQYFATHDAECQRMFGVPATRGNPRFTSDDQVICTSHFSKLEKLENGEIHTSLVNNRPGVSGPSLELQDFTRARYVRLKLLKLRTLNADLMIINGNADPSVTRRYFYSVKDISIGGQCICYGHAETCPIDPITGQLKCECRHNTCGESCNQCCPLFNQLPWQHGTNQEPHICQPCQCFSHATECKYDEETERLGLSVTPDGIYQGGGVCVDCQQNTRGVNCEECEDGFYRPAGVSHYREDACRPCQCDMTGSTTPTCIKDETRASINSNAGDCVCKPGFGGRQCDRCAEGYRNYPDCEPCPCNKAGSANYATCDDTCQCKRNVEGIYCDRCKPGFIGLDERNADGCQPCFCFGLSEECTQYESSIVKMPVKSGWNLTDLEGKMNVVVEQENEFSLTFNTKQVDQYGIYYWKAPQELNGNLLSTYGSYLQYYVYFVPEEEGPATPLADVKIRGNGVEMEYHSRQEFFERENVSIQVRLHENSGWYDSTTRRPITKELLMTALANVDQLLIRAKYHHRQVQSSLYGVSLEVPAEDGQNGDLTVGTVNVEQCTCPQNFEGTSCESCVSGFRRVGNQLVGGECAQCSCNQHSTQCDPYSGHCLNCAHNTAGERCHLCAQGFAGNPSLGGEEGECSECACPLVDNQFSDSCVLSPYGSPDDYICTNCQPGYGGNHCETCVDGYFGQPMSVNGSCKLCDCNENIDPIGVDNCDRVTGMCKKCIYNTQGDHCEDCKPNHYGSALRHDCKACKCHMHGAKQQQCSNETGMCDCNKSYVGRQCDRCEEGHGDVDNGCPECACDAVGSLGEWCDPESGQCQCKPGIFGKRCDTCQAGYYGYSESGCKYCGCNDYGSDKDRKCDMETGQCICKPSVTGQKCSECLSGTYNISSGEGCQPCDCHPDGAGGETCHAYSGQCSCKPGVTGLKCDGCAPNFYGLSPNGCTQCQICPAPGQVCDSVTGDCVCPKNTVGDMCEECTPNTWKYDPLQGCQECECDGVGSADGSCDLVSGQCSCETKFTGRMCDKCTHGHHNFPACVKCKCHKAGTKPSSCKMGAGCACDEEGQCPCKSNAKGDKCRECHPHSFSMEADNPHGCTKCFCFNRTNFCVQSSHVWQQIYAENRIAFFSEPYEPYSQVHGLRVIPGYSGTLNVYPTDWTPLYWSMPPKFLQDKISSYNGYLRMRVTNQNHNYMSGSTLPEERFFRHYPLVVLVGNHRIILEYYPQQLIADDGRYKIKLREDLWKSRVTPDIPVTREQMMIALQSIQALYVRATYLYRPAEASLDDVSLNVAVPSGSEAGLNTTAIGVEECGDCPMGYAGTSCQSPAAGYFRRRKSDFLNSEDDLDLIGTAEPCACHGHSITCDPETGRCTDCLHNTTGDLCNQCATGFFGDATEGVPTACTQCACPLIGNSYSPTCYKVSNSKGYVCGACAEGYEGNYCERCSQGYYGDPNVVGGSCKACKCHRDGSLSHTCDSTTGQCQCRPELTGRDCSQCQPRHALVGAMCTSCDTGCTLMLMNMVDDMQVEMAAYNFTGLIPAPWKGLKRVENQTAGLEGKLQEVVIGQAAAKLLLEDMEDEQKFLEEAKGVADVAKFRLGKINDTMNDLEDMTQSSKDMHKDIEDALTNAEDVFQRLREYAAVGFSSRSPVDLTNWVNEAEKHIDDMDDRSEHLEKRFNRAEMELKEARELLSRVQNQKLNDTSFEVLHEKLENLSDQIENMRDILWDDVRKPVTSASTIDGINKKTIDRYNIANGQTEAFVNEFEDNLQTARDDAAGATSALLQIHDHYMTVNESIIDQLKNVTELCDQQTRAVNNLLTDNYSNEPDYSTKYVSPAISHAEQLQYDAQRVKSSALPAKYESEQAVKASTAYNHIVEGLKNASDAAESAKNTAQNSFDQIFEQEPSLPKSAEASQETSEQLMQQSRALADEDTDQRAKLQSLELELGDLNEQLVRSQKTLTDGARFERFDNLNDEINLGSQQAEIALQAAEAIRKKVDDLGSKITNMAEQATTVSSFTGEGIDTLTKDVDASNVKMREAADRLKDVQIQADKNSERVDGLGDRLTLLKEKIKEAREKATKIRVSVKSNAGDSCSRAYMSPAHPTPTNILHIKYIPLEQVPDSLIFITKTQRTRTQPAEYMAVELKNQRFRFHWNVGGGEVGAHTITNEKTIYSVNPADRNTWYHIDVERRGNRAKLTVSLVKTTGLVTEALDEPITVEHGEETTSSVFNTEPGKTTINLGIPEDDTPDSISATEFQGTIGEIMIDGRKIPLWNFVHHDPGTTKHNCQGAVKPVTSTPEGFMFRDGYAQVDAGFERQLSTTGFKVFIRFAAYSPNGMLYFRGNPQDQDFLSVELKDGHVVLQFNLGSGSELRLESTRAYNDGKEHSVTAIRETSNATLVVNPASSQPDIVNGVAPGTNTGLNLPSESDHFVGGVPSSFEKSIFSRFNIEWSGFYGCVKEINPGNRQLDLGKAVKFMNYEAGCYMKDERLQTLDRVVYFSADDPDSKSFFVVSGVQLTDTSSFGFGFRTHDGNATLVYQSSTLTTYRRRVREIRSQGFIAAYLYKGKLTVHLGVDASDRSKVVTLASRENLDDGRLHSVLIIRDATKVELHIDDAPGAKPGTLEDRSPIGSPRAQMFLGGLPDRLLPSSEEVSGIFPFTGCISDLYVNYERVPMVPEEHANVLIGMCKLPNVPSIQEEGLQSDGSADPFSVEPSEPQSLPQTADQPHISQAVLQRKPLSTIASSVLCAAPAERISTGGSGAVQFGLQPYSYAQVSIKQIMQAKFPIAKYKALWRKNSTSLNVAVKLSYRTSEPNGVLWLWANTKLKQVMSLDVVDGRLRFRMVKTSKSGTRDKRCQVYSSQGQNYSDGQWHTVLVDKQGPKVVLTVDGSSSTSASDCANQINILRRRFFVGGIREAAARRLNHPVTSLIGCISNVTFNDVPIDLYDTVFKRQDVYRCFQQTNENMVHANNGYLQIIPDRKPDKVQVRFRTASPNGRVLSIVDSFDPRTVVDVTLREGDMYATMHIGGLTTASTAVTSSMPMCDGMWHTLIINISKTKMSLQIDEDRSHGAVDGGDKLKLMGMHLYLGGVDPDVDADLSAISSSFVGCLADLHIANTPVPWSNAVKYERFLTSFCPYA